ncbi:MAG: hypothetical protein WD404_01090 [Solirubrobacterales bacterium]
MIATVADVIGAPAAALVPIDEYEALEETAEVLSDPDALSALEAGLAEIERGETVTGCSMVLKRAEAAGHDGGRCRRCGLPGKSRNVFSDSLAVSRP